MPAGRDKGPRLRVVERFFNTTMEHMLDHPENVGHAPHRRAKSLHRGCTRSHYTDGCHKGDAQVEVREQREHLGQRSQEGLVGATDWPNADPTTGVTRRRSNDLPI